jgi:hypothetical protein
MRKQAWELVTSPEYAHIVIAPHHDDEFIGMNGLIQNKQVGKRSTVSVCFLHNPETVSLAEESMRGPESEAYCGSVNIKNNRGVCTVTHLYPKAGQHNEQHGAFPFDIENVLSSRLPMVIERECSCIEKGFVRKSRTAVIWVPDPTYETHPWHKTVSHMILTSFNFMYASYGKRNRVYDYIFGLYSIEMNAPYVHELPLTARMQKQYTAKKFFGSCEGYFENNPRSLWFEGRTLI